MRKLVLTAILAALAVAAPAGAQDVKAPATTTFGPTTSAAFDQRIENMSRDYLALYPQQRGDHIAISDMSYPIDASEYAAMGKYGVVLIAGIARDPAELPLARVFIRAEGHDFPLKRLWSGRRAVTPGSALEQMFGVNRQDDFYLVPIALLKPGAFLGCDFAAHRKDFVMGAVDTPQVGFVIVDKDRSPGAEPSEVVLRAFFAREYPGIVLAK
jgi:hypothetical protein